MIVKKLLVVLTLIAIFTACGKEKDTSDNLPAWLRGRITADESEIASDPQSSKSLGAWIQYEYHDSVYFEYHNLIMSSLPKVYQYDSTELNSSLPGYTEYQNWKCCKKFIWKGPSYFED